MTDPILVEVERGGIVESSHHGSFFVSDDCGNDIVSVGDTDRPIFPRSAIKAMQALPVLASGAAEGFGFSDEEIALCCASHGGEERHVAAAASMLKKIKLTEDSYECGSHWPTYQRRTNAMIVAGERPRQIHNNCSGKHAGMLALAKHLGNKPAGYIQPGHEVQQTIARTIGSLCDYDLAHTTCGIDGCSVPTWAIPLRKLALGFARFATGKTLSEKERIAANRIIASVRAHPFMVAGTDRFCTDVMASVPRVFVKTGAEGVFCGCIPHAGLGFALKVEDGATRASQIATAAVLASLDVWTAQEVEVLKDFSRRSVLNRKRLEIGIIRPSNELASKLA